ncbi:MAG: hypothetical protein PHQ55_09190 [Eubacteriales bacterium]|nr:hypothetical protein [Eubacteriales bacterium]
MKEVLLAQDLNTKVQLIHPQAVDNRVELGLEKIAASLKKCGIAVEHISEDDIDRKNIGTDAQDYAIYAASAGNSELIDYLAESDLLIYHQGKPGQEGFYLSSCTSRLTVIAGGCRTGALYGCLELAERIEELGGLPVDLAFADAPAMKLRGPAIGLQKTKLEPPRQTYEYPITPDRFPWFYDKTLWQDFLEMMLRQRCNVLYLWSGHPFASLVKVPEYPEALEVSEEEYQKNVELFSWLTAECDRRGIWVVLKFYNIHISLPFAEHHGIELHQSKPSALVADYTRKSIARFIEAYPHIGLMVCLGEALRGDQHKVDWCSDVILPGVLDGIELAQLEEHPPVIIRAHDCEPVSVMEAARKVYDNLYTMWKYNGESLTTWQQRGGWLKRHESLSSLDSTHIINVHVLANLEPFRFGSPKFIQRSIQSAFYQLGGRGLHLYPMFFWDWPWSPDKSEPRQRQMDRDFMWYETWFRYAWRPDRDPKLEQLYWRARLMEHFGCGEETAEALLEAYEASGECTPRLLRRIGITEGNRQTLSLGMTMSQLTNDRRYSPNRELWQSVAPAGERLSDYIAAEGREQAHLGETPENMLKQVIAYADRAVKAITTIKNSNDITRNAHDFTGLADDIEAIDLMMKHFNSKIQAALALMRYRRDMNENLIGDANLLDQSVSLLADSLDWYRKLTDLTSRTYLYANSMQTRQRKIPFADGDAYGHWQNCLPRYEEEYRFFSEQADRLKSGWHPGKDKEEEEAPAPLCESQIGLKILNDEYKPYTLARGELAFVDGAMDIQNIAPELVGLSSVKLNMDEAIRKGNTVRFELAQDAQLLIGYFQGGGLMWLQVPELETNTHADDRGGLKPVLTNAMKITGCPPVNVHAFRYEKGSHELYLGTGSFLILGAVAAETKIENRDAGMQKESLESLEWLYPQWD